MTLRSWLFVPGDSERKLAKAGVCGADAVVIDLEDAVAPEAKALARTQAARWLSAHRQQVVSGTAASRWVRINSFDSNLWREDLAVVLSGRPDGIMVPKARGPEQMRMLSAEMYEHEQRNGIAPNATRIVPMVGETAASALTIAAYASDELPRLAGITWGAQDLAVALGATRTRSAMTGEWTDAFQLVRSHALLAAHARHVAAIETPFTDFADLKGLKLAAEAAKTDGFTGMLAIHPDQVPVINLAFAPTDMEAAEARRIVELFAANPGAGALQLDGRMVEQPHLLQARRLLESLRG